MDWQSHNGSSISDLVHETDIWSAEGLLADRLLRVPCAQCLKIVNGQNVIWSHFALQSVIIGYFYTYTWLSNLPFLGSVSVLDSSTPRSSNPDVFTCVLGSRPCFSPPYYFLSAWMENSRPPSPSNYLPLPKYPAFPTLHPPTIGERARPRRAPSPPKATEDEHKKQDPLTHRFSDSPRDTAVAPEYQSPRDSSSRRRRGVGERTSEESMAKRIRRESPSASHKSKLPSSPESDSQADLADNEMDAKATDMKEQAEPAPAPKKKRTRTLTTPHQSAVLHALLAQVSFLRWKS